MRIYAQEDIDEQYEDAPEEIYCPKCLERGYKVRLGPKTLLPNEPRPDDYEDWLECGTCGWLCPINAVEPEATIKDTVETIESPFESKTIIESSPKRTNKTGKKIAARGRKRDKK